MNRFPLPVRRALAGVFLLALGAFGALVLLATLKVELILHKGTGVKLGTLACAGVLFWICTKNAFTAAVGWWSR